MTRTILVTSGKGGVGKTTVASNLAYNLAQLGQDVIAVDANLTTPNLGLHFGLHLPSKTLHDVLRGKAKVHQATYYHPFGFRVIPASMSVTDLVGVDISNLQGVLSNLVGKTDFVILDSAAGLGREAVSAIQAADEIILVTNPDLPSVADAMKTAKLAADSNKKILGVVLNRIKNSWYELSEGELQQALNLPILARIPEDEAVHKSIALKLPLSLHDFYSPASIELNRFAHSLIGRDFKFKPKKPGLLARLFGRK